RGRLRRCDRHLLVARRGLNNAERWSGEPLPRASRQCHVFPPRSRAGRTGVEPAIHPLRGRLTVCTPCRLEHGTAAPGRGQGARVERAVEQPNALPLSYSAKALAGFEPATLRTKSLYARSVGARPDRLTGG